ncbi:MAG: hypothetical protein NC244_07745 [Alistipes senegalensis]|nr:hypothetical protein [Alistipes senegalensis]
MESSSILTSAKTSTIKIPINYTQYVLCGQDYIINDNIILHNPTLKEILIDSTEDKYMQLVNLLTMRPYDNMVALDDEGLNYLDYTDYDIFLKNYVFFTPEFSSLLLGDLDLSAFVVAKSKINDNIVLFNEQTGAVIDEIVFSTIASYVRTINFISSKIEYDVGNEVARRELIKKQRRMLKRQSKKSKKDSSILANMISLLCASNYCKYDYNSIMNLKISQLYDNYYRMSMIDERDRYLNILSSGFVKVEHKDNSKLNWLRDLREE